MDEALLQKANEIAIKYGLKAEILEGILSVGAQGDDRVYWPVVMISGPFPGWDVIAKVSTEITNSLRVSRVIYDTASLTG